MMYLLHSCREARVCLLLVMVSTSALGLDTVAENAKQLRGKSRPSISKVSWFNPTQNGGTFTTRKKGWILRYDINDNKVCQDNQQQVLTKPKTNRTYESSFATFDVPNKGSVLKLNINGVVNQCNYNQFQADSTSVLSQNDRIDVLNIFLNGNWIHQSRGGGYGIELCNGYRTSTDVNDNNNSNSICLMGEPILTRTVTDGPAIKLNSGPNSISIEIITSSDLYHVNAFYEVELVVVDDATAVAASNTNTITIDTVSTSSTEK